MIAQEHSAKQNSRGASTESIAPPQERAGPTDNPLDGPALSEEVYHLALERIKALLGCTGDSPEERELIDWATIADAYEHSVPSNDNCSRRL